MALSKITLGLQLPRPQPPLITLSARVTGFITGVSTVDAQATLAYIEDAEPTAPLPPDNPGGQPNPQLPAFNPSALPKLPTQPSAALATGCLTEFIVAGVDCSECFLSGSWFSPLSGVSNGSAELAQLPGYNLNPRLPASIFKVGARVRWSQLLGDLKLLVCHAYIASPPAYKRDRSGKCTLSLELGDIFALKAADNNLNRKVYCPNGQPTTGSTANTLLAWLGKPQNAPVGRELPEPAGNFYEESPHEYLQALYAPLDIDVSTSNEGEILFTPRPRYEPARAISVDYTQTIESDQSTLIQPFTRVQATASYTSYTAPQQTTSVIREQSSGFTYDDRRPWYESGMTRSETQTTKLGSFILVQRVHTWGYIPVNKKIPKPKDGDNLPTPPPPADPCSPKGAASSTPTYWALISDKLTIGNIHSPGFNSTLPPEQQVAYETSTITTVDGYKMFETDDYWLIDQGRLEETTDLYRVEPQPEESVCPRNYSYLIVGHQHEERSLTHFRSYRLTKNNIRSWSKRGSGNTVVTSAGNVAAGRWTKYEYDYSYDPGTQEVKSDTTNLPDDPQEANWIRPEATEVDLSRLVSLPSAEARFGTLEAKPLVAPMCYTIEEVEAYTRRWLQEQAGMADHRILTVPYSLPVQPGSSIRFTDFDGTTIEGIAYSVEVSQDLSQATKHIILVPSFA